MLRRGFHVAPLVMALMMGTLVASWFPMSSNADVANLRDQLEKGLKARLPADFAFVNTVVTMVENRQLPLDLVRSSFLWVRKNRSNKRYMMFYFEQVLRKRAKAKGIIIP